MKTNITQLVFILDRSGSMSGIEEDTIGGYNSMLAKQKKEEGKALITTILFDDQYEILHDALNIKDVPPITSDDYFVRGSTALLDAIGKTITKIGNEQKLMNKELKADKVLFVITTDGMENASREYSYKKIDKLINLKKENDNWEFIFLGANIDAIATARKFGIRADRAVNYHADKKGTKLQYEELDRVVSEYRVNSSINHDWKENIEKDYLKRKKMK